jgi:tetratricopeptide (TPR) repeat protein
MELVLSTAKILAIGAIIFTSTGFNISHLLAQPKNENNQDIEPIILKFRSSIPQIKTYLRQGVGLGTDQRTFSDISSRNNFVKAWSNISPNASKYLGEWSGQENWLFVFPSINKDEVCVVNLPGDVPETVNFSHGKALASHISTSYNGQASISLIEDQGFLGLIGINDSRAWEQVYPKPLQKFNSSYNGRDVSKLNAQLEIYGCTASLPHQVFKEKGDGYYDKQMWSKAIDAYNKAIKSSPRYTATIYNRGLAYYYNGQNELALSDLTKAAQLYQEQGKEKDRDDAIAFIRKINPKYQALKPVSQSAPKNQSSLSSLANGNYRFCEIKVTSNLSQLDRQFANCFSFRKTKDHIVGVYSQGSGEDTFCFSGIISGTSASGKSIHSYHPILVSLPPEGKELVYQSKFYRLENPVTLRKFYDASNNGYGGVRNYQKSIIYLSKMYRWNAGDYVPPKSCSEFL